MVLALEILSRRIFAHVENDVQVKLTAAVSRFTASSQLCTVVRMSFRHAMLFRCNVHCVCSILVQ